MKLIINLFLLLIVLNSENISACVELKVKRHFSGDPLFYLNDGSIIEVCDDEKTITFGSNTFYIQRTGNGKNGEYLYYFSMDKGWNWPEVGFLMVTADLNACSIKIHNQSAIYGLYTPTEIKYEEQQKLIEEEKKKRIDKIKHNEINDLFSKGKIIDAYSKMNALNTPQEYPNYSEVNNSYKKFVQNRNEEEDKKIKSEITKLLKTKNTILDAAKKYSTLNSGDVTLYKQINESIEKYYGDETIEISKEKLEEIISLNKDNLTSLSNGKHIIVMNKNGELTILNQNLKLNKFNQSESKNYSNFVIALKSQAEIQIKSDTSAIQDAVIRSQTFDGCKIHKNIFGQPFRYKFLKGSWIRAYYDLSQDGYAYQKSEKNEHLSKKDLVYVKKSNINKYANSLLINTSEIDIVQKQEKLHNRLPKVIWRSTILTFGAFWIGLRSYEFSKIN